MPRPAGSTHSRPRATGTPAPATALRAADDDYHDAIVDIHTLPSRRPETVELLVQLTPPDHQPGHQPGVRRFRVTTTTTPDPAPGPGLEHSGPAPSVATADLPADLLEGCTDHTVAAAWPAGAHPGLSTQAWQELDWADPGDGVDPEQIEAGRRYLDDWPLPGCLNANGAAAETARIIPGPTGPGLGPEAGGARALFAILLHLPAHDYRDLDAVRTGAAALTGTGTTAGPITGHTCRGYGPGEVLALPTLYRALPTPALTRISDLITAALTPTDTVTTGGQRP